MSSCMISYAEQFEDSGITLMGYVRGAGRQPITPASIESISYRVIECTDKEQAEAANGEVVVEDTALVVDDVVFSPPSTGDGTWTKDDVGYTFRFDSPATDRPTGNRWHRYEFVFVPVSGAPLHAVWIVKTLPLAGS